MNFGSKLCANNCIAVGNGTDGLYASLKALNVITGDEVLTPAYSWISSSETISLCGAKPVFVDIDPTTYTIDPAQIESKITPQTKGIVVVHLYGQVAHLREIRNLCDKYNLFLIEDCAQSHLSAEDGQFAGTVGDTGVFSFYPTKNLGAYGDAGCVLAGNVALAEKIRRFTNHGALAKDDHLIEGMNSRMDALQAAILLAKLPFLSAWSEKRMANAKQYDALLKNTKSVVTPHVRPNTVHTFHIYAIRAERRDELKNYLAEKEIQTLIHYPTALPNLVAYRHLQHRPSDFPVASSLQSDVLSLPIYPEITSEQIAYVCKNIHEFYSK